LPLQWKINNLPVSYRMFAKYEAVIRQLATNLPDGDFGVDLRAMTWVLYLWAKHGEETELDIAQQTSLLYASLNILTKCLNLQPSLCGIFNKHFPALTELKQDGL
jgi:hypothetical protein